MLQVSEQFAGQVLKCEHCGAPYSVPVLPQAPALSSSAVAASAGNPGSSAAPPPSSDIYRLTQPEAAPPPPPRPELGSVPSSPPLDGIPLPQPVAGYQHLYSLWIKPQVVKWVPPVALTIVFVLQFAPWVVVPMRPGGNAVLVEHILTGWQTGFGTYNNGFGLVFTLAFLLSLVAAVAAVILPEVPPDRLHPRLHQALPWRAAIVFGLTAFAFLFLALEIVSGFGVENEPSFGTGWFRLAVLAEIVAVVAAGLEWWLTLRGPQQPLPRIDISW
jgi:hypothetical protein